MPPLTIKRKDALIKAVRRSATAQLDAAIAAITGPGPSDPARARRDLTRLQSLLHLVRRPLGGEVFARENRAVTRCLRALPPAAPALAQALATIATAEPAIEIAGLLDRITQDQTTPPAKPRNKKISPDPKQLRLVADLAEVRMRARYWHLPDGGFELLSPGLRQSYQQAAKLTPGTTPGSTPGSNPVSAPGSNPTSAPATPGTPGSEQWPQAAAALGRLADQLQALERAWPELLGATRKALRTAQRLAQQLADLEHLRPYVHDQPELLRRVDTQAAPIHQALVPLRSQLFAETPAAFTKRLGALFDAWRA